jgi:hypothetical protein
LAERGKKGAMTQFTGGSKNKANFGEITLIG